MFGLPASLGTAFKPAASGYVNSVQYVSITIASGSASNTATINSVDTSKTFIIWQGQSELTTNVTDGSQAFATITLTNATTVTVTRSASTTQSLTVNAIIVEGTSSLITSVQYGTITINGTNTTNTASITSVSTATSAVQFLGWQQDATVSTSSSNWSTKAMGVTLTNATTVTAAVGVAPGVGLNCTVGFVVIEFASGAIQSLQQFNAASTSANQTDAQSITAVTTNNTMVIYGGYTSANVGTANGFFYLNLSSTTNVNLVRSGTNTSTRTVKYAVVEFKSAVMAQAAQRGTITLSSVATNTATITALSAKGVANFNNCNSDTGGYQTAFHKITLTNTTTITATRAFASTAVAVVGYEALDFN